MAFEFHSVDNERPRVIQIIGDGRQLTYSDVIRLWRTDFAFADAFTMGLNDSGLRAFRWETPPVTVDTLESRFEFVLLDCPALDRPVDQFAFSDHFEESMPIVRFQNLGRDAELVVPCPETKDISCYGHLASFLRSGSPSQVRELWRNVGEAMNHRIGTAPVWLSTAGMGVSWLHVRLDDRPKYYGYAPYRVWPLQK